MPGWNEVSTALLGALCAILVAIKLVLQKNSKLKKENEILKNLSTKDELTGLYNRRFLTETLNSLLYDRREPHDHERSTRRRENAENLSHVIAMIDVNKLKEINDKFSHSHGDAIILKTANALKDGVRAGDQVFRVGGDEFVILLHNTNLEGAEKIAGRIASICDTMKIRFSGMDVDLRISIGLHEFAPTEEQIKAACEIADREMYKAKEKSRLTGKCEISSAQKHIN